MPMGDYDESEHERRVQKAAVDTEFDDERTEYDGEVSYEEGDADELIDQFQEIQAE